MKEPGVNNVVKLYYPGDPSAMELFSSRGIHDVQPISKMIGVDESHDEEDRIKEAIALGKKTVELRTQMNLRFFSAPKDRGHVRWIYKLGEEIERLQEKLQPAQSEDAEESDGQQPRLVYHSLLSPEIPFSALDHLPADSPARTLKETMLTLTEEWIKRLYEIAPSLNDSLPTIVNPEVPGTTREPDAGDHVMRYALREFILWQADEEVLLKARKIDNIDNFLRMVPWLLQDLIKFFESLGRADTLHFIRDAVCDYVASRHSTPDGSSVIILGEPVTTEDKRHKMTVEAWDILYAYFWNVVHWSNLESFCVDFEDAVLIHQLIAMGRYKNMPSGREWVEEDHVSQKNHFPILHGFVAATMGYSDPPIAPIVVNDGIATQRESRCYMVGRMAKRNPLADPLIQELVNRVARFIVIVLEMEDDDRSTSKVFARNEQHDDIPWITRTRSAAIGDDLDNAPWTTEWSFKNIMSDITLYANLKERGMRKDYFEFIIIEQAPSQEFRILDDIADAISLISGDIRPEETMRKIIRSSFPTEKQSKLLEAVKMDGKFPLNMNIGDLHYEGNRLRAWDILDKDPSFLRDFHDRKLVTRDRRLIYKILSEMEKKGIISRMKSNEPRSGRLLLLDGTDGQKDLYISYILKPTAENLFLQPRLSLQQLSGCLDSFSRAVKQRHPEAVFAKGRLHVHYCAWPMTPPDEIPAFATVEGHLYRWNALPFDHPFSSHLWQIHLENVLNKKLVFARFFQMTFVVSASHPAEAKSNLKTLLAETHKYGWSISIPEPQDWTSDIDGLDLLSLWKGIQPSAFKS
ncbi:uncharacterized protein BHQ10_005215 [Talaromyces amestolkiae]|uniref:Uncharacterized protein n=1 Tax=Talaromyces amestolkiae TaxID=1196081 RepID=A0A364L064_TALAM|nr:uncharacterized protein BHQ10_005215 [Talaromyces amestolkiae]RAO69203.1 hypothetical protein BHQ10_005215 [Talaromyces amestolkiae]